MTKKGPFPGGSHIHIGPAELDLPSRAYSLNLASQLGIPAHIYVSGTSNEGRPINEEERARIRHHVSGAQINTCTPKGRSDGFSIVITGALNPEQNTLDPKNNSAFDEHNQRRILVPLGQHTSGLRALDAALRIALATSSEIILYHTSWHKQEVVSEDPWHHLTPASRTVFVVAIERCKTAGVKVKMALETSKVSPNLCAAVVEAAYTHECNLIVLARGENTLVGSHAHTIKEISLVPVLIVANRYGHKTKQPTSLETSDEASARPFEILNSHSPTETRGTGWSSYTIMAVSFAKCLLQMAAFIWAWLHTRVELFLVQALHMGSDLVQNIFNIWVTHESRKPSTREFPFGKKGGPVIANFITGLVLWIFAGKLVYDSVYAALSPAQQQPHYPWILWAITGWFALNSLVIGPLQIRIGRSNHDPAVEGDGHETVSDALIDVVAFFGTLAMATFQAAWIEHVLSIVVACFIIRTGYELVSEGWKILNQHTIGLNHEEMIMSICKQMPGIVSATIAETFAVGTTAVCNLQLKTLAANGQMDLVRKVLETKISRYLKEVGFTSSRLHFQSELAPQSDGRIAIAVQKDSFGYVITPFDAATGFLICDRTGNGKDKVKVEPVGDSFGERVALLQRKHVGTVYAWTYERGADLARQGFNHNLAICRNPAYLVPALLTEH